VSHKGNVPEAEEKGNYHPLLNIRHFSSGGFWGSLFFFGIDFANPVRLAIGNYLWYRGMIGWLCKESRSRSTW